MPTLAATRVKQGRFKVFKTNRTTFPCELDYVVFGKRHDIAIEPDKSTVKVKGNGPYTWI